MTALALGRDGCARGLGRRSSFNIGRLGSRSS